MTPRTSVLTIGLALLAACGVVALFHYRTQGLEKVTRTIHGPPSRESRINPFLAAGRLLESFGYEVDTSRGLPADLGSRDILVYTVTRKVHTELREERLISWMEGGGHLIITPSPAEDEPDPLLWFIDVYPGDWINPDQLSMDLVAGQPLVVSFDAGIRPDDDEHVYRDPARSRYLSVGFPRLEQYVYEDTDETREMLEGELFLPEEDPFIGSFHVGDGRLTVVADDRWIHNYLIGQQDNAAVLLQLVSLTDGEGRVWFVVEDVIPPLITWLWTHAKVCFGALGMLLAAWLWKSASRFGPVLPAPSAERRSLLEHIDAAGWFLWKRRGGRALVAAMQDSLEETCGRRDPRWADHSNNEKVDSLARLTGLPAREIRRALSKGNMNDAKTFRQTVDLLTIIRKSL